MTEKQPLLWFGRATLAGEFEHIFRLNHQTFAAEIPQHPARGDGRLVDRFHAENEYVICKDDEDVVGMIALRGRRPFSLDEKLPDLDRYLPSGRPACEIRLLAVRPGYRHRRVLPGLVRALARVCRDHSYEYAVISGTTRQLKLYAHLGFEPFGPVVGKPGAYYQPMGIAIERFSSKVAWLDSPADARPAHPSPPAGTAIDLLPGPVRVHPDILAASAAPPCSHRSPGTVSLLEDCRRRLLSMTRADEVQVLLGSGTLANDAIAQQLRLAGTPGAVLSNGEFGERLIDHARRAGLAFVICRTKWGKSFNFDAIGSRIARNARPRWLWMAHCETSTGVLNDLAAFRQTARKLGADLVLDCVSSIGNVDVDLEGVAYASGVSGKGLAALPGLAFVFHGRNRVRNGPLVPRYLDLALYAASASIPFTHSSNLLAALGVALKRFDPRSFERHATTSAVVRAAIGSCGLRMADDGTAAALFVVTVALPPTVETAEVGDAMLARGYRIAFESHYLRARNWIQIAWMGGVDRVDVLRAVAALDEILCAGRRNLRAA
jgi:aspartate aminotransferase-like enzyme/GNAT superfamily N-acetyltransferase